MVVFLNNILILRGLNLIKRKKDLFGKKGRKKSLVNEEIIIIDEKATPVAVV